MKRRNTHYKSYLAGTVISIAALLLITHPLNAKFHAHGPMNTGHNDLKCEFCHKMAPGTFRQQLQANIRFFLGERATPAIVGFQPVGNRECIACHERPNDNHPVYRFVEPKFREARDKIRPHLCLSCHREHRGRRVTIVKEFCRNCHEKLAIKNDTISTSHATLVKKKRWETCLGCHDFHGNHRMRLRTQLADRITTEKINQYFNASSSPYSSRKKHKAKKRP